MKNGRVTLTCECGVAFSVKRSRAETGHTKHCPDCRGYRGQPPYARRSAYSGLSRDQVYQLVFAAGVAVGRARGAA